MGHLNPGRCPGLNYDAPLGLLDAPAIQTCDNSRLPADSVTPPRAYDTVMHPRASLTQHKHEQRMAAIRPEPKDFKEIKTCGFA